MPTIQANGLDIYYEEQGQGRPLILIHGGSLTGHSWQPYLAAFAAHFRVIMPDSRGHGQTTNPDGPLSYRQMAGDVAALAQALGLEKPLVFGYSDGGQTTLELGMRHPDLAGALVLGGTYPELPDYSRTWIRSNFGEFGQPIDIEKFEKHDPGFAAFQREQQGENWKQLLQDSKPMWSAELHYTDADWAAVSAPTLVIIGDRDELTGIEGGLELFQRLQNAELAVVPGSDHGSLLFSAENIARAQPVILDFLLRQ